MPDWPHAPVHRLDEQGTYFVTGGTYRKERFFRTPERLTLVQDALHELVAEFGWQLQAWAVLPNHYHFVALSPEHPDSLKAMLSKLHACTARHINRLDGAAGRQVWYQFWDTKLTFQRSYLARLNYVHENPVKHGAASVATRYPWCSALWFEQRADNAFQKVVSSFRTDLLNVYDDF